MATKDGANNESELDRVMEDIRRELVLRVAKADRDDHRSVYDVLEHE
ncbi:hypothetical protein [Haloferax sp. ATB1]|nr:hypothetical protein [Haloferax sp. ATB1]